VSETPEAAAEHFSLAWQQVKDRYESVSNQYALTLLELKRFDEAEGVLRGSLKMHPAAANERAPGPNSAAEERLHQGERGYLDALAVNRSTRKSFWPCTAARLRRGTTRSRAGAEGAAHAGAAARRKADSGGGGGVRPQRRPVRCEPHDPESAADAGAAAPVGN